MGKRELRAELESFDKKKLISLLFDLYEKDKTIKEHLEYLVNPNERDVLKAFKIKVREAFYPKQGFGFQLSKGKKAIADFRKLTPSTESLVDLLIYYVENGVEFTNDYGDMDVAFYTSLERIYANAIKLIGKNKLQSKFKNRANEVLMNVKHSGWGLCDKFSASYLSVYN